METDLHVQAIENDGKTQYYWIAKRLLLTDDEAAACIVINGRVLFDTAEEAIDAGIEYGNKHGFVINNGVVRLIEDSIRNSAQSRTFAILEPQNNGKTRVIFKDKQGFFADPTERL